jgi:trk system potassium uptake protein TrkH
MDDDTIEGVQSFFIVYLFFMAFCTLLISIDGFDFQTNFTASLACISNIGPGLGLVGPYGNYSMFSSFSKVILSIEMIAGRLELFPILILFSPKTWKKQV